LLPLVICLSESELSMSAAEEAWRELQESSLRKEENRGRAKDTTLNGMIKQLNRGGGGKRNGTKAKGSRGDETLRALLKPASGGVITARSAKNQASRATDLVPVPKDVDEGLVTQQVSGMPVLNLMCRSTGQALLLSFRRRKSTLWQQRMSGWMSAGGP
jgi:hypothetical protein